LLSDINVSQGSLATNARNGEIVNTHLTAKFTEECSRDFFLNWLRFVGIMAMSLWPHFFGPPCKRASHTVPAASTTQHHSTITSDTSPMTDNCINTKDTT